ncbi:hypothetical protein G9A89_007238 [Geosiphon pyriformis]|nr:hypothetical protein G9A89_007238 [Geosiphon pyriformis]
MLKRICRCSSKLSAKFNIGQWNPVEINALKKAIEKYGKSKKNDSVNSLKIKNRITDQRIIGKAPQVRDYQKWTVEEKTALIEFRRQNGLSWKIIAEKYFPDRTVNGIQKQYYAIKKQ